MPNWFRFNQSSRITSRVRLDHVTSPPRLAKRHNHLPWRRRRLWGLGEESCLPLTTTFSNCLSLSYRIRGDLRLSEVYPFDFADLDAAPATAQLQYLCISCRVHPAPPAYLQVISYFSVVSCVANFWPSVDTPTPSWCRDAPALM